MASPLRLLIIDDSSADALLLVRALNKGGLTVESHRVENAATMRDAMAAQPWDVAISDCHMPEFTPEGALAIWNEVGQDQPFIIASGEIGEEEAVALLKSGAHDFVRKDNLARLVPAIQRELRETQRRHDLRLAEKNLRESEEKYRLLFSTESDSIVIFDAQASKVMEVNAAATKLFGYSFEEFAALHIEDLSAEGCLDWMIADKVAGAGVPSVPLVHLKKKNDTFFPAEISTGSFLWKGHQLLAVIIRDISERLRAERMKDEMLSALSHELRTPLTAIIGFVDFMLDSDVETEQRHQCHEIIANEAKRLKEMIDNLLTLQRLRAGYGRDEFQPEAIWPLLQQTLDLFGPVPDKYRIVIDCSSDLPPVRGDGEKLQQAVENLLSNAIKYSPNGGTVTMGARAENGFAVLSVKDEGQGISPEDVEGIFDRFFHIDTSNVRRLGATGLGLPLVKEIANIHGGRVWVESTLGKGSTFFLTIPLDAEGKGA